MQDYLKPPHYCPEALATDIGWINPRNGELLVSVRNLRQKIADANSGKTIQYKREDIPTPTEKLLNALTQHTIAQPKVDDRTQMHKFLDKLTETTKPSDDLKSHTVKVLDKLSEQTIKPIEKRGRGRPRKH